MPLLKIRVRISKRGGHMKIFVSGLLNIETTVAVRGFPINYYPIDYSFFGVNSTVSGVGYNIAKALRTLGNEVLLSSFTGNDNEAEIIYKTLNENNISTENIRKTLKKTPASVILFDPNGKRQIYCDLKDIQEQSIKADNNIEKMINSCDIAALCNINFNRELVKNARNYNTKIATDVHVLGDIEDEYNRDFMENADILFLSDENLPTDACEFIKQLEDRYNNEIIVIGMGSKGAMMLDRNESKITTLEAHKNNNVVNTVGAGDALFSSFLHFYSKGQKPIEALKKAQIFASIKIGFNGAAEGFCGEDEVERIYRKTAR